MPKSASRKVACMAAFMASFLAVCAHADSPRLIFQTDKPWSPRVNIPADMVLAYGLDPSLPARIQGWRAHGYRVGFMTGVAWGHYPDYLDGRFDGHTHWQETQQYADGRLRLHTGRDTPYFAPTASYAAYLSQGVQHALDDGAEAVFLEEPEFWAESGWSPAFKEAWQRIYGEAWQPPNATPYLQWRASQLKYQLYRDTVASVCSAVHDWAKTHARSIPCNVATHSLLNYAQWQIVSPETSFVTMPPDGFIGQVWTGTARQPNTLAGVTASRTFATGFLEYSNLVQLARMAQVPIWLLADPVEDDPEHTWNDYQSNWKATLIASLMQGDSAHYEVLPWPNRIFDLKSRYAADGGGRSTISPQYQVVLQNAFHALSEMPDRNAQWLQAGTQGVGVLVSDTLMFQRAAPKPSDLLLGDVYGLALPLLMQGMPVVPLPMESTYIGPRAAHALDGMRLLLLSFRAQTPPSPQFTTALVAWVHAGGALALVDDGGNPVAAGAQAASQLLAALGAKPQAGDVQRIGKGAVLWLQAAPAALSHRADGAEQVRHVAKELAQAVGLPWQTSPALVLQRGDYVVVSGLEGAAASSVPGTFLDVLDAGLSVRESPLIKPGEVDLFRRITPVTLPTVLAASGKLSEMQASAQGLRFRLSGIDGRPGDFAVAAIALPQKPARVLVDGKAQSALDFDAAHHLLRLHLPASASGVSVQVDD